MRCRRQCQGRRDYMQGDFKLKIIELLKKEGYTQVKPVG